MSPRPGNGCREQDFDRTLIELMCEAPADDPPAPALSAERNDTHPRRYAPP